MPSYSAPAAVWVTVAVSSVLSVSEAALTVTGCGVAQFVDVKVKWAGEAVTSVLSVGSTMVMVTSEAGCLASRMV